MSITAKLKLLAAAAVLVEEFTESLLLRGNSTMHQAIDVDATS